MIELTEQQRQALGIGQNRPLDVVDPVTHRRYVLLAREQYEVLRPGGEGSSECHLPPSSDQSRPHSDAEQPKRVRLRDLPIPPEVAADADQWCKKYGWKPKDVLEQLKLQYFYGGQAIYVVSTPEGPVVVPIPEQHKDTPGLRYILLTPEERAHACLELPSPWRDTVSEILM